MSVTDLDPGLEAEMVALLARGAVRRVETHGARLFIGAVETIKIKRPVALAYMDFSTREKRQAACRREIEINATFAPDLYLGLVRITREADGRLACDGVGRTLELGVRMRTFAADAGLDCIADRGAIDRSLALALGDRVAALHRTAPAAAPGLGRPLALVRDRLFASADARRGVLGAEAVETLAAATQVQLQFAAPILELRRAAGALRRCHGDLHLGNIVLWLGMPTPFDAIEFDEELATIDPIYDLAFLLMDLVQRGQSAAATLVLNRYLWRLGPAALGDGTWAALRALPLAMALRALVRAVVSVDRARGAAASQLDAMRAEARRYLDRAIMLATPQPARLVAIGGFSGTGKSTLAAALAPGFGALPGAIHLRTDLERKALFGVEPDARLGSEGYTEEASERAYAVVLEKAHVALMAGHSVIVDAVFARETARARIEAVASTAGVPFSGLWLEAAPATLTARVAARKDDASDATVAVLTRQLAGTVGDITWKRVDASGGVDATLAAARATLA